MLQVVFVLLRGVLAGFRSRRDVALENLVLHHQLQVASEPTPLPDWGSRIAFSGSGCGSHGPHGASTSSSTLAPKGLAHLFGVGSRGGPPGRPRLSAEVRQLIGTMSGDNRLWGTERIRGELLKLEMVVSKRSIRRDRWRKPTPGGSQTWRTFPPTSSKESGRPICWWSTPLTTGPLRALPHPARPS